VCVCVCTPHCIIPFLFLFVNQHSPHPMSSQITPRHGTLKSVVLVVAFQARTWSLLIRDHRVDGQGEGGKVWCEADAQSRAGLRDRCCHHLPSALLSTNFGNGMNPLAVFMCLFN